MTVHLETDAETDAWRASELRIEIPGDPAHVRVARLVAADAANRAGFDCDDADDLRIAVDEMCHTLMASVDGGVTLRFDISPGRVVVDASAASPGAARPLRLNSLAESILAAVSDSYELSEGVSEVHFVVSKRATSGGAA